MRTINTLTELKEERLRLQMRKVFLETEIKNDFNDIKEQLKPLQLISMGAGKLLKGNDSTFAGDSVGYIANTLVKNVLLKNAGFVTRLILPFLAKNVASNVVEDNKGKVADWISGLIAKFSHRKAEANA